MRLRKFLPALLPVALVFVLSACGGDKTGSTGSEAAAGSGQETGGASQAAGPGGDAQAGVEHFLQNFVASAPPADPDGPEAQAAWDHLPNSRQAKLSEAGASSLHAGIANGQRGWKGHPGGGDTGLGASPSSGSASCRRRGSGTGMASMSALVYG